MTTSEADALLVFADALASPDWVSTAAANAANAVYDRDKEEQKKDRGLGVCSSHTPPDDSPILACITHTNTQTPNTRARTHTHTHTHTGEVVIRTDKETKAKRYVTPTSPKMAPR